MKIEKSPIIITGCARSGTSLIAGAINICGAFGGVMDGPTEYNEKGMFENTHIKERIEKTHLRLIGADPRCQNPLPSTKNMSIPSDWKERVDGTMVKEGYVKGPWFYKSAKACLLWPVWHYAYPKAKWVIVRRRSADIAQSCLDTAFMNAYDNYADWIKWINRHEERWVEMMNAGANVKVIWPERVVHGDYEQIYEVVEWLGLRWKSKEVMDHIEPKLWKSREKAGIKQ